MCPRGTILNDFGTFSEDFSVPFYTSLPFPRLLWQVALQTALQADSAIFLGSGGVTAHGVFVKPFAWSLCGHPRTWSWMNRWRIEDHVDGCPQEACSRCQEDHMCATLDETNARKLPQRTRPQTDPASTGEYSRKLPGRISILEPNWGHGLTGRPLTKSMQSWPNSEIKGSLRF